MSYAFIETCIYIWAHRQIFYIFQRHKFCVSRFVDLGLIMVVTWRGQEGTRIRLGNGQGMLKCCVFFIRKMYSDNSCIIFYKVFNVYFWDQALLCPPTSEQGRGRERGRLRIWTRLHAVSIQPDAGRELMKCNIMTRAKVGRLTNWAAQVPNMVLL